MALPLFAWSQVTMVHVTTCGAQAFPSTCTIPATSSGNLIVVGYQMSGSTATTITAITDNVGNSYTEAGASRAIDTGAHTVSDIWYAKNSLSGATSLTITPSVAVSNGLVVIWEFGGIDRTAPLDQVATLNNQPSTNLVSGATITTSSSIEAIVAIAVVGGGVSGIASGNAFTNDSTLQGNGWAHLITSSTGAYTAQWPQNPANTFAASTASFKAASSAPSFTISSISTSLAALAGATATTSVTITPSGGFSGSVTLGVNGLPQGVTASFNPTSILTAGSSVMTVTTASGTPAGTYPLTITGTSAALNQTAAISLLVNPPTAPPASSGSCDLNKDGTTNVLDVQIAIGKYLTCTSMPNVSSSVFITQVTNAALGQSCSIAPGARTVVLNWQASTTVGVAYNVYRATASGGYDYTAPLTSSISATSFADCTVIPGQTYYYVIRSVDSNGNHSTNSNEAIAAVPAQ